MSQVSGSEFRVGAPLAHRPLDSIKGATERRGGSGRGAGEDMRKARPQHAGIREVGPVGRHVLLGAVAWEGDQRDAGAEVAEVTSSRRWPLWPATRSCCRLAFQRRCLIATGTPPAQLRPAGKPRDDPTWVEPTQRRWVKSGSTPLQTPRAASAETRALAQSGPDLRPIVRAKILLYLAPESQDDNSTSAQGSAGDVGSWRTRKRRPGCPGWQRYYSAYDWQPRTASGAPLDVGHPHVAPAACAAGRASPGGNAMRGPATMCRELRLLRWAGTRGVRGERGRAEGRKLIGATNGLVTMNGE